jgi:hypothetical protein
MPLSESSPASPAPKGGFLSRITLKHLFVGVCACLGAGVLIYRYAGGLGWVDSLYNASMILSSMGPVDKLTTTPAKLMASAYAIFCGAFLLAFIAFSVDKLLIKYSR